jgi:flagellar protein FlaG
MWCRSVALWSGLRFTKERNMSTDIASAGSQRLPQPAVTVGSPSAQGPAAPSKPELKVPEKAKINFDPKEMQQNLSEAIAKLNAQMKNSGRDLNFTVDEVIDRPIITVKNTETGKVIRQIPNEAVLQVAHQIENAKGLLYNKRV